MAYCWGQAPFNRRFTGEQAPVDNLSVPTRLTAQENIVSVSTMGEYACGLSDRGALLCWGYGTIGQFGSDFPERCPIDPYNVCRHSENPVPFFPEVIFSLISTRGHHACGLSPSGVALCWGANGAGGLGDGTFEDSSVPQAVQGDRTFIDISTAITGYTCAVAADGTAYCWGRRVGSDRQMATNVPTSVTSTVPFSSISTGWAHACAVAFDGSAYCWGFNNGMLGDATTMFQTEPVRVRAPGANTFD